MDYTPGEHDYSLLPAPIHVGERPRKCRPVFAARDYLWKPEPSSLSIREVSEAKADSFPVTLRCHVAVAARSGK